MKSSGRAYPGLALADTSYETEANTYFQSRVRIYYAVCGLFALVLWLGVACMILVDTGWNVHQIFFKPSRVVHLASIALTGLIYLGLRKHAKPRRVLMMLDAAGIYITFATCFSLFIIEYHENMGAFAGILALFIVSRAIVVPSSARWTFLLGLPAPVATLVIQLTKGTAYSETWEEMSRAAFVEKMIVDQITLWVGLGLAALASKINFMLRSEISETRKLGQYQLEHKLGEGGMGEVYLARHAMLRRPTAIKLLHPEITGKETLERFEREVRETSRLTHPNTVSVFDYGRTPEGVFYYAMELLDGLDAGELVAKHGPLPPARAIHLLKQACGALKEAHDHNLVHRDIKPGNIMVCCSGGEHDVVKVVDFGLVKDLSSANPSVTQIGQICGTPETLAPEVLGGLGTTGAADQYALGVVGYYMLTGVSVWDTSSAAEFIGHHLHSAPVPLRERNPDLPGDLEGVLLRCLAKRPEERHASVGALRDALRECADANRWSEADAEQWWNANRTD